MQESTSLRRVLQYDNIPNAVITYVNDPSSAGQGIADNVSPAHHKSIHAAMLRYTRLVMIAP